jgi:hypothetical protein
LSNTQALDSRRVIIAVVLTLIGVALGTALFPGLGVVVAVGGLFVPVVRRSRPATITVVIAGIISLLISALILFAVYGPMDVNYTFH